MKDIKVLGMDLAKDVFQIHGTDGKGAMLNVRFLFSKTAIGVPCSLTTYCIAASTSASFHTYRVLPCRVHRFIRSVLSMLHCFEIITRSLY